MKSLIEKVIGESIRVKQELIKDSNIINQIDQASSHLINTFNNHNKFFAAGNGGSASDAQHIVAELVGRFNYDRPPLNAEALSTNTSNITCIGNDYGYDHIFERQIWANAKKGDYFLAISTSGNSKNILLAAERAKNMGIYVLGLTGETGGLLKEYCDINICIPSSNTARIQECHILLGHLLCELVELKLYPKE